MGLYWLVRPLGTVRLIFCCTGSRENINNEVSGSAHLKIEILIIERWSVSYVTSAQVTYETDHLSVHLTMSIALNCFLCILL